MEENGGKWRKIVKKTIKLEEKMNGKLGKTKEIEEIVGKMRKFTGKILKNRRNAGKGLKKMHEMEARQSFEKARNIEANILKKLRIRSSTESSARWGSEQDSLQGDEECWRGRNGEGLQAKTNMKKKKREYADTFQTTNLAHIPNCRDISI